MIIDYRAYTMHSGGVLPFMDLFVNEGLEPQQRILGNFLGIYRTEVGPINQIIMMFAYQDLNDRQIRRDALFKDTAFLAYLAKVRPYLRDQEVRLLAPSACNPPIGDTVFTR